jgi:hypothetical protein
MPVTEGFGLFDELDPVPVIAGGGGKSGLITRRNDDADFLDAGGEDFLDDNAKGGFSGAIAIDEGLQRESSLIFAGRSDDGFFDFHGVVFSTRSPGRRGLQKCAGQSTLGGLDRIDGWTGWTGFGLRARFRRRGRILSQASRVRQCEAGRWSG